MEYDFERKDLRVVKTEISLHRAIHTLLQTNSFRKITVRDICEEAMVSRATFYTYYMDKYDLLRRWLSITLPSDLGSHRTYESIEKPINHFVNTHKIVIKNIMEDAADETVDIVIEAILNMLELTGVSGSGQHDYKYVAVSNMLAGGIMRYVTWHVRNRFPADLMNTHMYNIVYGTIERYTRGQL